MRPYEAKRILSAPAGNKPPQAAPKRQPSAAGAVWRGEARERARNARLGRSERSGLCFDDMAVLKLDEE